MTFRPLAAPLLGALLLAACGGSDEPTVAVTGSVFPAQAAGVTVVARDAAGAAVSAAASAAADGTFTLAVPQSRATSQLFLEASGLAFTGGGAGPTAAVAAPGVLSAHAPAGVLAGGGALHLTPQSTVVAALVKGGATRAEADAAFALAFGFTPDASVAPLNAALPATPAAADLDRARAALRAMALARLAAGLGVEPLALYQALAADAADGALDGRAGAAPLTVSGVVLPADLKNRFAAALMACRTDAANLTGLKVDQIGQPPFARTALTASYLVEYLDGALAPATRRSDFQVRVTDRVTGLPVTGAAVSLEPKMHMSTKSHACPVNPVTDAGGGRYDATAYYVMASAMADGTSMGVWELGVRVGAELATFYPQVGMTMGDTQFVRLTVPNGSTDLIMASPGAAAAKRTYQLFRDGFTFADGLGTLQLMISTMDTMMTFPHLSAGATFHDGAGAAFAVGAVAVRVSADGGATWVDASDAGDGHWTAAGLTGLTAGSAAPLRVELTVAGEVKLTQDLLASYATFTATPGGM